MNRHEAVARKPFYKCMYQHCRGESLPNHMICRMHLHFEIAITVVVGSAGIGAIIWFITAFGQHLNTRALG